MSFPPFFPQQQGPPLGLQGPPAVGLPHLVPQTHAHIPAVYPPNIAQVTSSSYGHFYMTPQLYGAAPEYISTGYDVYGKLATAAEALNSNNRASAVVAYQMGASLAHDHLGADRCADLRKSQIILIDCTGGMMPPDPRMRLMIESIGTSTITNLSMDALTNTPIAPLTRVIFILGVPGKDNSAFQPISEAAATRLREFVENGGHLITIGNGIQYLAQIFDLSDTVEPTTRYILQKLPTKLQLGRANANTNIQADDEEIKRYFSAYGEENFAVLEPNNVVVKILDPSKALVLCTAPELHKKLGPNLDSLVTQIRKGRGVITHLTSIFCRKKKLHINLPQDYVKELKKQRPSNATMMAWKLAADVGFSDTFWEAESASPFQELVGNLIVSHPIPPPLKSNAATQSAAPAGEEQTNQHGFETNNTNGKDHDDHQNDSS